MLIKRILFSRNSKVLSLQELTLFKEQGQEFHIREISFVDISLHIYIFLRHESRNKEQSIAN